MLHIDFETRGSVDLKVVGAENYASHADTDVWCMAYAEDTHAPKIWTPLMGDEPLATSFVRNGHLVMAHNAAFELAIWNSIMVPRYGWPELKLSQTRCTMAMAYAMDLPGALDNAAMALGMVQQKDKVGHRLMLQMCAPKTESPLTWWDEPEKIAQLCEYCLQDVRVEQGICERLLALSPAEQKLWGLDQEINGRGVHLDVETIQKAIVVVEKEQARLTIQMREVTKGAVGSPSQIAAIISWAADKYPLEGLANQDIIDVLLLDIPDAVREVLKIRQEYAKTSTTKLKSMITAKAQDNRVRGTMQFHGAGTGRWAGRRIQPHNMPRPTMKPEEIDEILRIINAYNPDQAIRTIETLYGPTISSVSECLRSIICAAPGNELIIADYKNIEGRVIAWLAGEEWKLQVFRDFDNGIGPDVYKYGYAKSFNVSVESVTKQQRQIGKIQELALGYQGGVGAFKKMAFTHGVKIEDTEADVIKRLWREAHPNIQQYWWDLERAAMDAVHYPGQVFSAGAPGRQVRYKTSGSFLFCQLPSGRLLCYCYPILKERTMPWGDLKLALHYKCVDSMTNKWVETHTYGGKLSENVTQAVARDILAEAIVRCEEEQFPVVLHVHDEIIVEMEAGHATAMEQQVYRAIGTQPAWAGGLPIALDKYRGIRYNK
jgi:DNA polymerase bacteriophage-type